MTEKVYEFRRLEATDLFLMTNLVKKIGLDTIANEFLTEDTMKMLVGKGGTDLDYAMVGKSVFNVAQVIINKLSDCQDEVFALLEATSNLTLEEIKKLDLSVFINMIVDFVKKEEFPELFTQVASLFNKGK